MSENYSISYFSNQVQKNQNKGDIAQSVKFLNPENKQIEKKSEGTNRYQQFINTHQIFSNKINPFSKPQDKENQDFQSFIIDTFNRPFPGIVHTKKLLVFWVKIDDKVRKLKFKTKNGDTLDFETITEANDIEKGFQYYEVSIPISRSLSLVSLDIVAEGSIYNEKNCCIKESAVCNFTTPFFIVHSNFQLPKQKKFFRCQNMFLKTQCKGTDLKLKYFMATIPFQQKNNHILECKPESFTLYISFLNIETGEALHFDWITNKLQFKKNSKTISFRLNSLGDGIFKVGINYTSIKYAEKTNKSEFDYQFKLILKNNTVISSSLSDNEPLDKSNVSNSPLVNCSNSVSINSTAKVSSVNSNATANTAMIINKLEHFPSTRNRPKLKTKSSNVENTTTTVSAIANVEINSTDFTDNESLVFPTIDIFNSPNPSNGVPSINSSPLLTNIPISPFQTSSPIETFQSLSNTISCNIDSSVHYSENNQQQSFLSSSISQLMMPYSEELLTTPNNIRDSFNNIISAVNNNYNSNSFLNQSISSLFVDERPLKKVKLPNYSEENQYLDEELIHHI